MKKFRSQHLLLFEPLFLHCHFFSCFLLVLLLLWFFIQFSYIFILLLLYFPFVLFLLIFSLSPFLLFARFFFLFFYFDDGNSCYSFSCRLPATYAGARACNVYTHYDSTYTEIFHFFLFLLLLFVRFVCSPDARPVRANANICKNSAAFVFYAFFFLLAKCFSSVLFSSWIISINFSFSFRIQCARLRFWSVRSGTRTIRHSFETVRYLWNLCANTNARIVPGFIGCHAFLCKVYMPFHFHVSQRTTHGRLGECMSEAFGCLSKCAMRTHEMFRFWFWCFEGRIRDHKHVPIEPSTPWDNLSETLTISHFGFSPNTFRPGIIHFTLFLVRVKWLWRPCKLLGFNHFLYFEMNSVFACTPWNAA